MYVFSLNGSMKSKSLGARYKRHSALTMPLFRRAKIISNFDLVMDCTDKLVDNWRSVSTQHIHTNIVQQCQNLILEIFGFIAFDYDFETLNGTRGNELTIALRDLLSTVEIASYVPSLFLKVYLKLNLRYRRARSIIQRYLYKMIEQELQESRESREQRKKSSLIASLVDSLQMDEQNEAKKREEDKIGRYFAQK